MTDTPGPPIRGRGAAGAAPSPMTRAAGPSDRRTILVVEDNPDILRYLVLLLQQAGHHVRSAATIARAVELANQGPIDLLLSDIGLPDGTGLELLRSLRSERPGLPAVAFSGFGSDDDIRNSLEAGFAVHLTKPLDFRRLSEAIDRALGE